MPTDLKELLERMAEEASPAREVPPRLLSRARRRRVGTVMAGLTVAAAVAAASVVAVRAVQRGAPVVPAAEACTWEQVEVPSQAPRLTRVLAVAPVAEDDAWAVGDTYEEGEGGDQRSLILHWNGSAWSEVDHPPATSLTGLDATGGDDVWAVGFAENRGVVLHWDGSSWTEAPVKDPRRGSWHLNDVAAVQANQVWVVGGTSDGNSGALFLEHWDGRVWSIEVTLEPRPAPQTSEPYAELRAIDALTSSDVWAVGDTANVAPAGPSNGFYVWSDPWGWSGGRLPDVPADDGLPYTTMFDVLVDGPDDVWAVGIAASEPGFGGGGDRAVTLRRDAQGWLVEEVLGADSRLMGIAAAPDGPLVAVGSTGVPGSYEPLVLEWDDGGWTPMSVPGRGYLSGVAATPRGELWAVGAEEQGGGLALRCR
jgi:hypothetical protein